MSSKCALVKVLNDQQTKPVNLNESKICGTTQLVEVEKLIEDKELQEVNHELFPYLFHFYIYLFQLEEGQIVYCLFNYYSVLRIFKCSLLTNELKIGEPGPVDQNKRPLSIYSTNETQPLTKKQNKKNVASNRIDSEEENENEINVVVSNNQFKNT